MQQSKHWSRTLPRKFSAVTPIEHDEPKNDEEEEFSRKVTLGHMRSLAEKQKHRLLLGLGLGTLSSGLGLIFPRAVGSLLDISLAEVSTSSDSALPVSPPEPFLQVVEMLGLQDTAGSGTLLICSGLFGVAILQSALSVARTRVLVTAGENVSSKLREDALTNLVKQEIAYFDREDSAEIVNRLSADTERLKSILSSSLVSATRSGTMAVGSTLAIFYTSPSLAVMSLACFPPVFLFAAWKGRHLRRQQRAVQDASAAANAIAQRCLGSLRTLRQLGAEASMVPTYGAAVRGARDHAVRVGSSQVCQSRPF